MLKLIPIEIIIYNITLNQTEIKILIKSLKGLLTLIFLSVFIFDTIINNANKWVYKSVVKS